MAIVGNRLYNDEALGQGFSNLAAAFAPPSGSDLAGYATAAGRKQQNDIIARLAADPRYAGFDQQAILADLYDPSSSFYSVDQGNATQRFGYETQANTSIANNIRDNASAVYGHNRAYDASTENNALTNKTDLLQTIYGPLNQGQIAPEIPAQIADMYGLPGVIPQRAGLPPTLSEEEMKGAILAQQSPAIQAAVAQRDIPVELVQTPTGPVYTRRNEAVGQAPYKPMSETEQKAKERQDLIDAGALPPDLQLEMLRGEQTPVEVAGPDGKPVFTAPGAALGQTAYEKPAAEDTTNYRTPDGVTGTAHRDPASHHWIDDDTGQPLPANTVTFTAAVQGGAADTGLLKTTEAQDRSSYAYQMADQATEDILTAIDAGKLPTANDYRVMSVVNSPFSTMIRPELIQGVSPEGQAFYQNLRTALPFQLMTQSGQAVTEQEYDRKMMELLPIAGEAPAVTAAKRRQFQTYLQAVKSIAGPALKNAEKSGAPAAAGDDTIPPPPEGVDPEDWKYMTPEQRKLWQS